MAMRVIESFIIAFSMYSKLPMPHSEWKKEDMKYVMCFFPLVGAVIGLILWFWAYLSQRFSFGTALFCAGAVALPLLITGGIHMDGFCDTADALASYATRERRIEILKDSHAGAFAVIACGLYLSVQTCLWAAFQPDPEALFCVSVGFVLSRSLSGISVVSFPSANTNGTVALFSGAAETKLSMVILCGIAALCTVCLIGLGGIIGTLAVAAAAFVFIYYYWKSRRAFGGVNGDLAGWFLQLCELFLLLAIVLAQKVIG